MNFKTGNLKLLDQWSRKVKLQRNVKRADGMCCTIMSTKVHIMETLGEEQVKGQSPLQKIIAEKILI